jgi:hypothetical protein
VYDEVAVLLLLVLEGKIGENGEFIMLLLGRGWGHV